MRINCELNHGYRGEATSAMKPLRRHSLAATGACCFQIGTITYSYRSMPDQSGDATLKYIVDSGISAIELMSGPAGQFAGAPASGRGGGGRRGEQTPAQQAAQRAAAEQLKQWRLSVSMDKYKALRKKYNDAGVTIYAWKCLNPNMSDQEIEYVFNVAQALGCTHTTLELTDDVAQRRCSPFSTGRFRSRT